MTGSFYLVCLGGGGGGGRLLPVLFQASCLPGHPVNLRLKGLPNVTHGKRGRVNRHVNPSILAPDYLSF